MSAKEPATERATEPLDTQSMNLPQVNLPPAIPPQANLPRGWVATAAADGGTELRVSAAGRGYLVTGALVLAAITLWRAMALWPTLPASNQQFRIVLSVLLVLFAVWCAFADAVWRINTNRIEYSVGMGTMRYSRRYQDAELEIVELRTSDGSPYYRLYVVAGQKRRFLMERNVEDLRTLARFMAAITGWRTR